MIIRDALGAPAPAATLAGYQGIRQSSWDPPSVWRIKSCGHMPAGLTERFSSAADALAAAEAAGYTAVERRDGFGHPVWDLTHTETAAELERLRSLAADKWRAAKPCYVRYGRLPAGGRSRNYADGTLEAGVSVFRGQRLPSGEARALPNSAQEVGTYLHLRDRQLYIVTGQEIGTGSDGEPVLANARIWRRAK